MNIQKTVESAYDAVRHKVADVIEGVRDAVGVGSPEPAQQPGPAPGPAKQPLHDNNLNKREEQFNTAERPPGPPLPDGARRAPQVPKIGAAPAERGPKGRESGDQRAEARGREGYNPEMSTGSAQNRQESSGRTTPTNDRQGGQRHDGDRAGSAGDHPAHRRAPANSPPPSKTDGRPTDIVDKSKVPLTTHDAVSELNALSYPKPPPALREALARADGEVNKQQLPGHAAYNDDKALKKSERNTKNDEKSGEKGAEKRDESAPKDARGEAKANGSRADRQPNGRGMQPKL